MTKREKYIRKRKNGSYQVSVPYIAEDGKREYVTETFNPKDFGGSSDSAFKAAFKQRNKILSEIELGKLQKRFPTVSQLYESKWSILPLSKSTRKKQDGVFRHAFQAYKDTSIKDITVKDIQLCLNDYSITHSQDATNRVMTVWKQLYKSAIILGYDVQDITQAVIIPRSRNVPTKRDVQMSMDDFRTVLDGLLQYNAKDGEQYNYRAIWFMLIIMYFTGMRPAEARALTAKDIKQDYISINKSVGSTLSDKTSIVPTKTAESERAIPIAPALRPYLVQLLQWSKNEYLLADENGNLLDIDYVSNTIHLVAKKHKVKFNAYMLRHLMSTELLHNGDSVIARDLLGHTSFSMTLDYARSTNDQLLDAIKDRNISANNTPTFHIHDWQQTAIISNALSELQLAIMRLTAILSAYQK